MNNNINQLKRMHGIKGISSQGFGADQISKFGGPSHGSHHGSHHGPHPGSHPGSYYPGPGYYPRPGGAALPFVGGLLTGTLLSPLGGASTPVSSYPTYQPYPYPPTPYAYPYPPNYPYAYPPYPY